ncbi:hypothetical protein LCGC14_1396700 [marine sediment metagenome]|uniref:Uncharacterized protein n=1 Tax=marine sediment metagenome TaxID=412755 RepID=A0A0F9MZZ0_9ZZZZ
MMYIKHVPTDDHENIYEATRVTNIAKKAAQRILPEKAVLGKRNFGFFFTTPEGKYLQLTHGEVFVMNEAGKTIQQYRLSGDPKNTIVLPISLF